ncbi:MAG: hypothetical protein K0U41_06475 [Gammaproteobacteria bacterium]|nr:hypothetical protein [Gammaproteobacteria bacterium]
MTIKQSLSCACHNKTTTTATKWTKPMPTNDSQDIDLLNKALLNNDMPQALLVIKTMCQKQGIVNIANRTGIAHSNIYHALHKTGNPTLKTLLVIIKALDLELKVTCREP